MMKRVATIAFYAIGVLAMLYLALYAYVTFTGRDFEPGDPIHIFRKPDAPNYSWGVRSFQGTRGVNHVRNCAPEGA